MYLRLCACVCVPVCACSFEHTHTHITATKEDSEGINRAVLQAAAEAVSAAVKSGNVDKVCFVCYVWLFVGWAVGWLVGWLAGWLVGLVDWPVGRLFG